MKSLSIKSPFLALAFLSVATIAAAQKISDSFDPLIKQMPGSLKIQPYTNGTYLVYGEIQYYGNSISGSIVQVDQNGDRVSSFRMVSTDQMIEKVAILPSGNILICGPFHYLNGRHTGNLALLQPDGSPDASFSIDDDLKVRDFAVQSTGKIIVFSDNLVSRLNTDGSPDGTFSAPLSSLGMRGFVGPDDKIYISVSSLHVYRLEADGAMDTSFSLTLPARGSITLFGLQSDHKIIAAVYTTDPNPPYQATQTIRRYHTDGTLDDTFASPATGEYIRSAAVRRNDKIVLTGSLTSLEGITGNAFELNADGSFNRSLLTLDTNNGYEVCEDDDENIFITGGFTEANDLPTLKQIVKIKPDYSIDSSFKVPVSRTAGSDFYLQMVVQPDGKILYGGGFVFSGVGDNSSKLVRTLANGEVDETFEPQIRRGGFTNVTSVSVLPDGKIIVGGSNLFDGPSSAFNRLLPNGRIDETFQIGSGFAQSNGWVPAVLQVRDRNSRIYVSGLFDRFNDKVCQSFAILDESGNMIGPEQNVLPPDSYFQDMEVQSDGKVILLGSFPLSDTDHRNLVRLNADGSLDESFLLKNVDGGLVDLDIDEDDNILITGNYIDQTRNKLVVRCSPDGGIVSVLEQGTGFSSGTDFINGYFVKAISPNLIAVGGRFSGYNGTSSPGLVFLDSLGSLLPFANPFDSSSLPLVATHGTGALYVAGYLSQDHGQSIEGGLKILFPVENSVTDYRVQARSDSTITISWSGSYRNAAQITVEQSAPDDMHYEVVAFLPPSSQSFEAEGLSELTPYYFRVTASNESYSSEALVAHDTTFISPQKALSPSEVTDSSFVANWEYLPGTDSCMLQVSSDNFSSFLPGYEKLMLASGSKLIEGLEAGQMYLYRVKRFRNGKSSDFSGTVTVNVISGVEDESMAVRIFPNPTFDHLRIDVAENYTMASVSVHSIRGELLYTASLINRSHLDLDTRNLSPGVFIITISTGNEHRRFKVVKYAGH